MLQLPRPLRLLALLVGVLALALAVAGCGGADQATATTRAGVSSDLTQAALAFTRCMRQHGINLPDPRLDAQGNLRLEGPPGVGPDGPKFKAAEQACAQYLPK